MSGRLRWWVVAMAALLAAGCAAPGTLPQAALADALAAADGTGAPPREVDQFEADIARFQQEDARVRRQPGGVVFVGSSSIRLWSTLAEDLPAAAAINRGFGGSRVYDSVRYADRIVVPYQPRAVVFYAGDNDLQEGRSPEQVRADVLAFVQRVRAGAPQARIGFVSIKPSPSRAALLPQVRRANALVREAIAGVRGVDYLDVYTPMLGSDGQPREGLFVADRLHMNGEGYAIWTEVVGRWLAQR